MPAAPEPACSFLSAAKTSSDGRASTSPAATAGAAAGGRAVGDAGPANDAAVVANME